MHLTLFQLDRNSRKLNFTFLVVLSIPLDLWPNTVKSWASQSRKLNWWFHNNFCSVCSGKSQWYILSPMLNSWIFLRLPIPDVNQETDMTSMEPYVCILMYFHLVFWMKDSALYTHSGEVEEQFMLHLPSSLIGKFLAIKRSLSIEELNKLSNLSLSASAEAAKQSMLFGSDFSILAGKGENIFFDLTLNSRIKI